MDILVASLPDREKVVAEIYLNDDQIVEINQVKDDLEIIFYCKKGQNLNLGEFLDAIESAKEKLLNP